MLPQLRQIHGRAVSTKQGRFHRFRVKTGYIDIDETGYIDIDETDYIDIDETYSQFECYVLESVNPRPNSGFP